MMYANITAYLLSVQLSLMCYPTGYGKCQSEGSFFSKKSHTQLATLVNWQKITDSF